MEKKHTQVDDIYEYLRIHGSITAKEGFNDLWIIDLAGRIRDLNKKYPINSVWQYGVNHRGHPVRWKKYFLAEEKPEKKETLFQKIKKLI